MVEALRQSPEGLFFDALNVIGMYITVGKRNVSVEDAGRYVENPKTQVEQLLAKRELPLSAKLEYILNMGKRYEKKYDENLGVSPEVFCQKLAEVLGVELLQEERTKVAA